MTEPIRKVVVTWSGYRDRILKRSGLEGYGHLEFLFSDDKDEIVSGLADADAAFIGPWDTDMLTAGSKLRWIHAIGGGVRDYLFPEMVESDIPFTCGKPAFAIPGAEFALGAMLMFSRRNHVTVGTPKLTQRSPSQEVALRPVDLQGKTLGVLGMGGIGQALAPRAKVMGMRVLGTARRTRETPEGVDRMYRADEAADMVAESDFVAVAVPDTPETVGIVSEGLLAGIKRGASHTGLFGAYGAVRLRSVGAGAGVGTSGGRMFSARRGFPRNAAGRLGVLETRQRRGFDVQGNVLRAGGSLYRVVLRESSPVRVRATAVGVGGQESGVLRGGESRKYCVGSGK